jgi:FHA domain-containing protein
MVASLAPATARPNWLMLVVGVHLVFGLPWVLAGLLFLAAAAGLTREDALPAILAPYALIIGYILLLIGVLYGVIAWGVYRVREWASVNAIAIAILTSVILIGVAVGSPFASPILALLTLIKIAAEAVMIYYVGWKWPGTTNLGFVTSPTSPGPAASGAADGSSAAAAEPVSPGGAPADNRNGNQTAMPPGEKCPNSGCDYVGITRGMSACPKCSRPLPRKGDSGPQPMVVVDRPAAPVLGLMVVRTGPGTGSQFPLTGNVQVGRDSACQIILADRYVSRRHASLRLENNRFFIYDLNTTGGTWVNDNRVQRRMLYDGDRIRIGQTTLEFRRAAAQR